MPGSVEVIICTHQRADLLKDTLFSVLSQQMPKGWKPNLCVVDSGPKDDCTREVFDEFLGSLEKKYSCRYEREDTPGLSVARNRGVSSSVADWIVFIDDDVWLPQSWLKEVCRSVEERPEWSIGAGPMVSVWERGKPAWVRSSLEFGTHNYGSFPRRYLFPDFPAGGNFWVKRQAALKVGPFNVNLGRVRHNLRGFEDGDFIWRAMDQGNFVGYWPSAPVVHRMIEERATVDYAKKMLSALGRQRASIDVGSGHRFYALKRLFRVFIGFCRSIFVLPFAQIDHGVRGDQNHAGFLALPLWQCKVAFNTNYLRQWFAQVGLGRKETGDFSLNP